MSFFFGYVTPLEFIIDERFEYYSENSENAQAALEMIEDIVREIEVGGIYYGKVTKIMAFGAFVDVGCGKEGLLHISKISSKRVEKVEDVLINSYNNED